MPLRRSLLFVGSHKLRHLAQGGLYRVHVPRFERDLELLLDRPHPGRKLDLRHAAESPFRPAASLPADSLQTA